MMTPLRVNPSQRRYHAMIGVGGIGSGVFFALDGNRTLGREESRGGRFLDRRDYCKLHIISHYVKTLLGPEFVVLPVGKLGADEVGRRIFGEMENAGLDMRYVEFSPGDQTLFGFCFLYPDGSGGNLTVSDSACARVDGPFVGKAEPEFARFEGRGVALAAPEVPLEAREKLLDLGTAYRFLRVASFVSAEIGSAAEAGLLSKIDLLAINQDEAAALVGRSAEDSRPLAVVEAAVERLCEVNPGMLVSITAGKNGSWSWDGASVVHIPAFRAELVNTAGAGDAHLSGVIAGLSSGLTLSAAQELGTLVAAFSVTSPHTIAPGVERQPLRQFAARVHAPISAAVRRLLED
jgi:ribokinase